VELAKQMQKLGLEPCRARQCRAAPARRPPAARPDLADLSERPGATSAPIRCRPEEVVLTRSQRSLCVRGVGTDIGTIHFVGIGGIGMSGIAR
jgi:hypothetical protein